MAMYDPNSARDAGGKQNTMCGEGRKVGTPVGFRRWESQRGTPILDVEFVCVLDLEDPGPNTDQGCRFTGRFFLTDNAMWRFGRFCQAIGHDEPLDPDLDEHIERVLARGSVICTVQHDEYNGRTNPRAEKFEPFTGDTEPDWDAVVQSAEDDYASYLQHMADKYGTGLAASSPAPAHSRKSNKTANDADIPF